MRQPVAVDQPNIPAALRVILDALPTERLVGVLYELGRLHGVIGAVPEPAAAPAIAGKRSVGWPKGRKRGPRKVRTVEPIVEPAALPVAPAKSPDAELRARRERENAARKARRAAAKARNGANGAHSTTTTPSATSARDRAAAKKARHAEDMRKRRAREAAARPADGADKATEALAAAMWARAEAMAPGKADAAAARLGVTIVRVQVHNTAEIEPAISAFAAAPDGGLLFSGNHPRASFEAIRRLALHYRLPLMIGPSPIVAEGAMMSHGPDGLDLVRRAASYVDRILRGAKPGELPVQYPSKFELVVNLKTAKAIGVTIPEAFLARADEVIE